MAYDQRRDLRGGDRQQRNLQLPDGVPASNQDAQDASASFSSPGFTAPDMATPRFAQKRKPAQGTEQSFEQTSGVHAATTLRAPRGLDAAPTIDGAPTRGNDKAPRRPWLSPGQTILFAAILILLGALGVSVLLSGAGGGVPLCADQPQWNQYNCRAY